MSLYDQYQEDQKKKDKTSLYDTYTASRKEASNPTPTPSQAAAVEQKQSVPSRMMGVVNNVVSGAKQVLGKLFDNQEKKIQAPQVDLSQLKKPVTPIPDLAGNTPTETSAQLATPKPAKNLLDTSYGSGGLDQFGLPKATISAAPPQTVFEKVGAWVNKALGLDPQADAVARAQNAYAVLKLHPELNKVTNLNKLAAPGGSPFKNSDMENITAELGIRNTLTNSEFTNLMVALSLPVSFAAGAEGLALFGSKAIPLSTQLIELGKFTAVSTAFDLAFNKLTGKQSLSDLAPDSPQYVQISLDALELIAKGYASHGINAKLGNDVKDLMTKTTLEKYNIPKTTTLSSEAIRDIHQTGGLTTAEQKQWVVDLKKEGKLTDQDYLDILKGKKDLTIEIPATKVVSIVDRPYWAKVKSFFGVSPNEPKTVTTEYSAGKTPTVGQKISGLLPEGQPSSPPITFTNDGLISHVNSTDLQGTPLGTEMTKIAGEAGASGQMVEIFPVATAGKGTFQNPSPEGKFFGYNLIAGTSEIPAAGQPAGKIEPSVVQIVDTKNNTTEFKTIPQGQLEEFKKLIDDTQTGIAGKTIDGKVYHLTAKTPEQMIAGGAKESGTAQLSDIPKAPIEAAAGGSEIAPAPETPVLEPPTVKIDQQQAVIEAAYSGDIITNGKVKTPLTINGKEYTVTGMQGKFGETNKIKAEELITAADYKGPTYTYGEKVALPHEGGMSYAGVKVKYGNTNYVLSGKTVMLEGKTAVLPPSQRPELQAKLKGRTVTDVTPPGYGPEPAPAPAAAPAPKTKAVDPEKIHAKIVQKNPSIPVLGGMMVQNGKAMTSDLAVWVESDTNLPDGWYQRIGDEWVARKPGIPAEEFPTMSTADKPVFSMLAEDLNKMITKMLPSTSTDDSRPVLRAINLTFDEGGATAVTTDGFRVLRQRYENMKVMAKTGDSLLLAFPDELAKVTPILTGKVEVNSGENTNTLASPHSTVGVKELSGNFPEVSRVIDPVQPNGVWTVNAGEIGQALRTLAPFAKESQNILRVKPEGETLTLTAGTGDLIKTISVKMVHTKISSPHALPQNVGMVMPVRTAADESANTIGFNDKYLASMIKQIGTDTVDIGYMLVDDKLAMGVEVPNGKIETLKAVPFTEGGEMAKAPPAVSPPKVEPKPAGVGAYANRDAFADLENLTKNIDAEKLHVVEFPEVVRLAEELMNGNRPVITNTARGNYRGLFRPMGDGMIVLKANIFKTPGQAAKTLAHEVGHLMDYLPDKSMARGNILGRLATLREFMKGQFSDHETEAKIDELSQRVESLQEQRRALKGEDGKVLPQNKTQDNALLREMKPLNAEIKTLNKNAIKDKVVREELLNLSAKWRPIEGGTGTAADIAGDDYRASSPELYADAMSVLFNDPMRLKAEAPTFFESFFKFLDEKPKVQDEFFKLQQLLEGDPETVFQARDEAMRDSFAKAEDKFTAVIAEKQVRKVSLMQQVRTLFDNKNQPMVDKVKEAIKAGVKIEDSKNPMYEMEGMNYLDSKLKNYVQENFQPVFETAQQVPDGWNTLGKVLQLERSIYERGDLANPGGFDPKTAQDQLTQLEAHTDTGDWQKIQKAKLAFRTAVQNSIDIAEKAGYYKPAMIEVMKANPAYAAFQVVDYLDTYVSAKVYRSVGTLKDIANPATSTVMKMVSLMKAIERNKVKVDSVDLLVEAFPKEVQPAKSRFNGRNREFVDPKSRDQGLIITIRNGEAVGHYVDKSIADTMNYTSNETMQMAASVIRKISLSGFYRPLFTSINLGFQTFNFTRDFMRYWKNTPDYTFGQAVTSFPRAMKRYAQAAPHAMARTLGKPDPIIQEMENSKMLGMNYNDIFKQQVDPEEAQIERVLQRVGILDKTKKRGIFTPIFKVLEGVELMGNFIESLPKVAGYIELKDKMPTEELGSFIRTKIGSPDFKTTGTFSPITNNILLFSNAIKEGIKSDFQVATGGVGKQSQSGFWWKTAMSTVVPKILMAGIAAGLAGKWYKDRMDDVSEYDKTNYTILPLGQDETGKTVYLRIPQDETSRLVGAITWKAQKVITSGKASIDDFFGLFAVGAGQFPNLSPSFTGIGAIVEYLSGKNPYDSFRSRNVVPDREFAAGPQYSLPIFMNWLLQNQGLGIIIPSYVADNPGKLQNILNWPVVSNIVGRWIKVSDYGKTEQLNAIGKNILKEQAISNIEQDKIINDRLQTYNKSGDKSLLGRLKFERETVDAVWKSLDKEQQTTEKKTALKKEIHLDALKGSADANTNSLIRATSNAQKAEILKALYHNMSIEKFTAFQNQSLKDKIISPDVIATFRKIKDQ